MVYRTGKKTRKMLLYAVENIVAKLKLAVQDVKVEGRVTLFRYAFTNKCTDRKKIHSDNRWWDV